MSRPAKDQSYTSKQEAKVTYPKLRNRKRSEAINHEAEQMPPLESRQTGRSDHSKSPTSSSGGDEVNNSLSRTFSKVDVAKGDEPSRELLADIILNNSVFLSHTNRMQFETILTKFIAEKSGDA